jgi:hypothetical protein
MSNHICVEPTKFENVRTGEVSLGVRVYDDEGCFYDNSWDEIPDDDMEVLRLTMERASDDIRTVLCCVSGAERGLFIGGKWYDWEQVKPYLEL